MPECKIPFGQWVFEVHFIIKIKLIISKHSYSNIMNNAIKCQYWPYKQIFNTVYWDQYIPNLFFKLKRSTNLIAQPLLALKVGSLDLLRAYSWICYNGILSPKQWLAQSQLFTSDSKWGFVLRLPPPRFLSTPSVAQRLMFLQGMPKLRLISVIDIYSSK